MSIATLTSKGQITIPKDVRDALGLATGDRVEFVAEEEGVYRVVAATTGSSNSNLKGHGMALALSYLTRIG